MKNIVKLLNEIQLNMKAPKDKRNEFGKFNYRDAESILLAVKPHLQGSVVMINDEPVCVEGWHYIKATVTLTDGVESINVSAYAREDLARKGMSDSQCTGSTSSYARKYALSALFAISGESDEDAENNWDKEIAEYKRLVDLCKEDTTANALDIYIFKQEFEVEEWMAIFFGYLDQYAIKGGKGKLKATLKEFNDYGMEQAFQYRDEGDENDELTEYQAAFIQTLKDGQ